MVAKCTNMFIVKYVEHWSIYDETRGPWATSLAQETVLINKHVHNAMIIP